MSDPTRIVDQAEVVVNRLFKVGCGDPLAAAELTKLMWLIQSYREDRCPRCGARPEPIEVTGFGEADRIYASGCPCSP